ncbi:OmpA family protein [Cellulomonas triticagri]|uniref:OmpA family protein n=1 Tax=Cellulomonas triticagri TaxID=2483352 RepID=A0A3M2JMF1_9CELL|nr:OmpA family protein [Cellulomonas triticagri]RMI13456.1 OmpA family protein [Cellulomonas triticagri]
MPAVTRVRAAALTVSLLLLPACSAGKPTPERSADRPAEAAAPTPSASAAQRDARPAVTGYAPGEIPPVPLVVLPDLSMLDASLAGFALDLDAAVGDLPGITVTPTRCDATTGAVESSRGALLAYGDGSGVFTGPDGGVVNYGDGSGTYTIAGTTVTVYGDGSGTYSAGGTQVVAYGDGSGLYDDGTTAVTIHSDGSGSWARGDRSIVNYGDGSGLYTDGATRVVNYGDGSGLYDDGDLVVQNWGDGTGTVDGVPVEVDPLPVVPPLGAFPSMGVIAPVESCGATLTLDAGVLFDFGSAEIRPDAAAALDTLAAALADVASPAGTVAGHTDSVSSAELNQRLSEDRADAVAAALADRGVTTAFDVVGRGEDQPVAPNEVAGQDNPAGRQLNRRVEILLPSVTS